MKRILKTNEEGRFNSEEKADMHSQLPETSEGVRAKIARLSETNKVLEMLAVLFRLLTKAPKKLIPLYVAVACVLLSACGASEVSAHEAPEVVIRESGMRGLSIERKKKPNTDTGAKPETIAALKRIDELLNTSVKIGERQKIDIWRSEDGKTNVGIIDIESQKSVENISYRAETMTPVSWYQFQPEKEIVEKSTFFTNKGLPQSIRILRTDGAESVFYDTKGEPFLSLRERGAESDYKVLKHNGENLGTFTDEVEKNLNLNPEEYMELLADELDNYERLASFLEHYMKYTHDTPDRKNPLQKGTGLEEHREYWQTAYETIARVENGKMLGDCEDYCFLAREILRRQGKLAHVVAIPRHAACMWLERNREGKYNAYYLSTGGLMKNEKQGLDAYEESDTEGYSTPKEALNACLKEVNDEVEDSVMIDEIINGEELLLRVPLEIFMSEKKYVKAIESTKPYDRRKK